MDNIDPYTNGQVYVARVYPEWNADNRPILTKQHMVYVQMEWRKVSKEKKMNLTIALKPKEGYCDFFVCREYSGGSDFIPIAPKPAEPSGEEPIAQAKELTPEQRQKKTEKNKAKKEKAKAKKTVAKEDLDA